jgi:ribosome-binding factor A
MGKSNRPKSATSSRHRARESEVSYGSRTVQLQELIREEVNFLLRNTICDPLLSGVVVTMVQLAGDGSCVRLWFTAETQEDKVPALERAAGFLRNQIAEGLALKRTPELRFRRDPATRQLDPH